MMSANINTYLAHDIIRDLYKDIKEELHSSDPEINTILDQVLVTHGKAVRPAFMALLAQFAGGTWTSVQRAALVIEAIHVASLLHDDVIDGSELRRGVETLNARYSDKISVLSGDYVFIKAVILCHQIKDPVVTSVILSAVERMIRGEIRDSLTTGVIDEKTYLSIAADKTASLFAAAGEVGIMLSGKSGLDRVWGCNIGEYIGIAFQIVDDTLDFKGDSSVMGKPGLMDVIAGRMTLPLIFSLRKYKREKIMEMLSDGESSVDELSTLVRNNGGIEYALGCARDYLEKARKISGRFGNSNAQVALDDFIEMLVDRNF